MESGRDQDVLAAVGTPHDWGGGGAAVLHCQCQRHPPVRPAVNTGAEVDADATPRRRLRCPSGQLRSPKGTEGPAEPAVGTVVAGR